MRGLRGAEDVGDGGRAASMSCWCCELLYLLSCAFVERTSATFLLLAAACAMLPAPPRPYMVVDVFWCWACRLGTTESKHVNAGEEKMVNCDMVVV